MHEVEMNWGLVFKLRKALPVMVAAKNTIKKISELCDFCHMLEALKKKKKAI